MNDTTTPAPQLSDAARITALALAAHPDYRVLRRLAPQRQYSTPGPDIQLLRGAVVDTETTGTDVDSDLLIEVSIIPFTYTADGQIVEVLEDQVYTGQQDPGVPLSELIQEITGLTDEDLEGKHFDLPAIEAAISPCAIVIAHHAAFDRPMLERLSPSFRDKVWLCSLELVDWRKEGISSSKLEFIAMMMGFFFEAHRAEADARALLHLLSIPLPVSGELPLSVMRRAIQEPLYSVSWLDTPYSAKGDFGRLGYRWRPVPGGRMGHRKFVHVDAISDELTSAMDALAKHQCDVSPVVLPVNPMDRFTPRA